MIDEGDMGSVEALQSLSDWMNWTVEMVVTIRRRRRRLAYDEAAIGAEADRAVDDILGRGLGNRRLIGTDDYPQLIETTLRWAREQLRPGELPDE